MKCLKEVSLLLVITTLLFSCKKSNDSAATPKDYSASIKDKNWWGTLAYTGKTAEYYSVAFKADNSLSWSQRSGDTPGLWTLVGKTITITFSGNTVKITADISDDNTLTNIQDNTTASEITSGQLITTPNVYLDNTTWNGTIPSSSQTLQLIFTPGQKVTMGPGSGTPFGPYMYDRVAGGSSFRLNIPAYGGNVLGIMVSNAEMKGCGAVGANNYQWSATLK